jgi:hypothetical protein
MCFTRIHPTPPDAVHPPLGVIVFHDPVVVAAVAVHFEEFLRARWKGEFWVSAREGVVHTTAPLADFDHIIALVLQYVAEYHPACGWEIQEPMGPVNY